MKVILVNTSLIIEILEKRTKSCLYKKIRHSFTGAGFFVLLNVHDQPSRQQSSSRAMVSRSMF